MNRKVFPDCPNDVLQETKGKDRMKSMSLHWICVTVFVASATLSVAAPNPPTAENPNISITPVVRSFDRTGGTGAINTAGSGTWAASVSDSWIRLVGGTSGAAGYAVAYTVDANANIETRTGYVYVSGYVHTITQAGVGASLDHESDSFETAGGTGTVTVNAPSGKGWHAKSNAPWITVRSSTGSGLQQVTYDVARYDEVSTRSGTLTIADNTFTVHQTGRRMKLTTTGATTDYTAEALKIRINALADTTWSVSVNANWLTVTDAGNGRGGDVVSVAVAENPSVNARNATVTIGTETFSVRQLGRTALVFRIDAREESYGADGATGERFGVTATPDLGWTAQASADWIELYQGYGVGSGNGNVMYKIKPNPTLYPRSGTLTVTAANAGVAAKRVEIAQEAAVASLGMDGYEFEANGESATVDVLTGDIVGWSVINTLPWITVSGVPSAGPAGVVLTAKKNPSVEPRSGTLSIADHLFTVRQKGRGVTVDYEARVFDTDGKTSGENAENVIQVTAEGDVLWTAVPSDPTWIVIYEGREGSGNGTVKYIVSPYVGSGEVRNGTIAIGDQTVYITQRPYDLSIEPNGNWVDGNAGAGEIQVALDIAGVWEALTSEPWITLVSGYDAGTGSGKVLFEYTDNNTGKTRTGKIVIAGEVYTITQAARQNVTVTAAVAGHGGHVTGGGVYSVGSMATLSAVADDGYVFAGWTLPGGGTSAAPELVVTVTAASTYTASFTPCVPQTAVESACLAGVTLVWTNLPWAAEYRVWRGTTSTRSQATQVASVPNVGTCRYTDATGVENQNYWYWIEAVGAEDDVWGGAVQGTRSKQTFAVTYENLRGTTHANPATYREGTTVTFTPPGTRRGYTFVRWEPAQITASTSGNLTVRAVWSQNEYTVHFDANGGTGTMADEHFTYGFWKYLGETNFMRGDSSFSGWAQTPDGAVAYTNRQSVKNLTATANGTVTLYAIWPNGDVTVRTGDGTLVTIPASWFETGKIGNRSVFSPSAFAAKFGTDRQRAAESPSGKKDASGRAMYVWQDFVAGTNPLDLNDLLRADISIENGNIVIRWTPDLNAETVQRIYHVKGKASLGNAAWGYPARATDRFFKVEVSMPVEGETGDPSETIIGTGR